MLLRNEFPLVHRTGLAWGLVLPPVRVVAPHRTSPLPARSDVSPRTQSHQGFALQ